MKLAEKITTGMTTDTIAGSIQYSTDGATFRQAGNPFYAIRGNWKGVRLGIYHYNTRAAEGYVNIGNVKYNINK